MQTTEIDRSVVEAMLQRGRTRMVQAVINESGLRDAHKMFDHWCGFANCAAALLSGAATAMASHDQTGDTDGAVQVAFTRLPDDCERLSFIEMKRLVRSQGVDFAADAVAHSDVDAVVQLQDRVGMVIKPDDEHAVARVNVGDGGEVHGAPLVVGADILAQGGAT